MNSGSVSNRSMRGREPPASHGAASFDEERESMDGGPVSNRSTRGGSEPPASFGEWIERFCRHLGGERGLSARTVEAYRRDLAEFAPVPRIGAGTGLAGDRSRGGAGVRRVAASA